MYTAEGEEGAKGGMEWALSLNTNATPPFFSIKVWKEHKTQTWTLLPPQFTLCCLFFLFYNYSSLSQVYFFFFLGFNTFLCCNTGRLPFTDSAVLILLLFFSPTGKYIFVSYFKPSRCCCLCVCPSHVCICERQAYSSRRISPECAALSLSSSPSFSSFCDSHKSLIGSSSPLYSHLLSNSSLQLAVESYATRSVCTVPFFFPQCKSLFFIMITKRWCSDWLFLQCFFTILVSFRW